MLSRLKYHDAFLKQSNSHVQKLEIEVEKIHDILSKQQEQGLTAYLIQLEELKGNVTEIMLKLQEGTRLSQRDFHKLNDLYALIEDKGNKDEILQKVDKKELKQAYRHLSKKIDSVQAEIKKFEETKLAHKSFDKATLFKQKPNSECLACGQDVAAQSSSAREWVSSGSFPAFSHSRVISK